MIISTYISIIALISVRTLADNYCDDNSITQSMCLPKFHNIALFKTITSSSTCGMDSPTKMCSTDGCDVCDANVNHLMHPPSFLTDFNYHQAKKTCWRSDNIYQNHTEPIVLELYLRKTYELSYMSVQTCDNTVRLASIAVQISSDYGITWSKLGHYFDRCETNLRAHKTDCLQWLINPIFNRISISFIGIKNDDVNSAPKATNIKFYLHAKYPEINNISSYISLSDLSMGGRCHCNGHASTCKKDSVDGSYHCICAHHTTGRDCEKCEDMYQDVPWSPATLSNSHQQCMACKCNNHAESCVFSLTRYLSTRNQTGGICHQCTHNTEGVACERCKNGYTRDHRYLISDKLACTACHCHKIGSQSDTCHPVTGQCVCKFGVIGLKCDRCAQGFYQTRSQDIPCKGQMLNLTRNELFRPRMSSFYDRPMKSAKFKHCKETCLPSNSLTMSEFCKAKYGTEIYYFNCSLSLLVITFLFFFTVPALKH